MPNHRIPLRSIDAVMLFWRLDLSSLENSTRVLGLVALHALLWPLLPLPMDPGTEEPPQLHKELRIIEGTALGVQRWLLKFLGGSHLTCKTQWIVDGWNVDQVASYSIDLNLPWWTIIHSTRNKDTPLQAVTFYVNPKPPRKNVGGNRRPVFGNIWIPLLDFLGTASSVQDSKPRGCWPPYTPLHSQPRSQAPSRGSDREGSREEAGSNLARVTLASTLLASASGVQGPVRLRDLSPCS